MKQTLSSPADRLLQLLKTRGPQQAADAGKVLGTTAEAARQQFTKLALSGLVEAYSQSRGVGRPNQYWQLTTAGHARFPDTHSELTVQLIDSVRETFGEAGIEQLLKTREQQSLETCGQALNGARNLRERVERLTAIRSREGYMAEFEQRPDGSFLFTENHCPIYAAAASCQSFCRAELSLFKQVLQAEVERTEHILHGARCCAYIIKPQNPG